jgi:hypothetical protein
MARKDGIPKDNDKVKLLNNPLSSFLLWYHSPLVSPLSKHFYGYYIIMYFSSSCMLLHIHEHIMVNIPTTLQSYPATWTHMNSLVGPLICKLSWIFY